MSTAVLPQFCASPTAGDGWEGAVTSLAGPSLVLRHAAIKATYAPSVYNTQPWCMRLTPTDLRLHADPERWLMSMDRLARQLLISCGCALFNVRASVAADGWTAGVARSTADLASSSLVATVGLAKDGIDAGDAARAELSVDVQASPKDEREPYPLPDAAELMDRLQAATSAEGSELVPIVHRGHWMALSEIGDRAEELLRRDRAGRTKHWVWANMFDCSDWSNPRVESAAYLIAAVLCTHTDTARDWVTAGESLQRVLLELARSGHAADISVPAIELSEVRSQIRSSLDLAAFPQVLLRIGQAARPPAVPQRRLLVDVIHETVDG